MAPRPCHRTAGIGRGKGSANNRFPTVPPRSCTTPQAVGVCIPATFVVDLSWRGHIYCALRIVPIRCFPPCPVWCRVLPRSSCWSGGVVYVSVGAGAAVLQDLAHRDVDDARFRRHRPPCAGVLPQSKLKNVTASSIAADGSLLALGLLLRSVREPLPIA